MKRRLPPLNALRAFEAAARHGSFVRAAEELYVTPSAISQQVKLLETHLGTGLFRRGKQLELTASGEAMLPLLSEALDQIERAMRKAQPDSADNILVVSAPPAFSARWLIPRLENFQSHHPDIELRLDATKRLVDFQAEDVDLAIRFGTGDYPGLTAERLMQEAIIPVASPALAANIRTPEELARHTLLEDDWHTGNRVFPDWATWLVTLGITDTSALRIRHFSDANLAIQAAASGLGATLSWHSLVADDLKAGRLVRLLDQSLSTNLGYYLVMPQNLEHTNKISTFRSWLLTQAEHQPPL